MMTKEQINGIIACLQEHAQTIDSSKDLKQFFESNFEFDGYYSIDESYRDYFVSDSYLRNEVSKCIASNENAFIDTLSKCVKPDCWRNHKNKIETKRYYTTDDEVRFVFKELDDADYSNFSTMQGIIKHRIDEMKKCYTAGAYLSVIILAGSVLEALLVSLYGKKDFSILIEEAKENKLLNKFAYDNSSVLRVYRNLIHPHKQKTDAVNFEISKNNAEFFVKTLSTVIVNIVKKDNNK